MAVALAPRLCRLQPALASCRLSGLRAAAGRPCIVCAAAGSHSRGRSSAAGSRPPPAAAAAAPTPEPTARSSSGPLEQPRRRELAEKLTETARNISWLDHPDKRMPEASRAQIEALEARLVSKPWVALCTVNAVRLFVCKPALQWYSGRLQPLCTDHQLHAVFGAPRPGYSFRALFLDVAHLHALPCASPARRATRSATATCCAWRLCTRAPRPPRERSLDGDRCCFPGFGCPAGPSGCAWRASVAGMLPHQPHTTPARPAPCLAGATTSWLGWAMQRCTLWSQRRLGPSWATLQWEPLGESWAGCWAAPPLVVTPGTDASSASLLRPP